MRRNTHPLRTFNGVKNMRIGGLDINGGVIAGGIIENVASFPTEPQPGRIDFKDKRLWVCGEVASGVPMWLPCSQELEMISFVQSTNADTWIIPHQFGSNKLAVQVYDENSKWVFPEEIKTESNQVTVKFLQPTTGFVVILSGSTIGTPAPNTSFTANFADSDTWAINHMLGYDPIVQCIVGTAVVVPETIEHDPSHTVSTVYFSTAVSGQARCV